MNRFKKKKGEEEEEKKSKYKKKKNAVREGDGEKDESCRRILSKGVICLDFSVISLYSYSRLKTCNQNAHDFSTSSAFF